MSNYSLNALVILTCFRLADNTTVGGLAVDKFPGSFTARHHDGTLGLGLLPSNQGLGLPFRVSQSRAILPGYRLA